MSLRRMKYRVQNDEVLYLEGPLPAVTAADLEELKARARRSPLQRARLCAHADPGEAIHEMLIVLVRGGYIRPHRHPGKSESFHVVSGTVDLAFFHEDGRLAEVLAMGEFGHPGRSFYCRMPEGLYHTLLIRSEELIVHETTNGPFDPSATDFAPWAPEARDAGACQAFLADLEARLAA